VRVPVIDESVARSLRLVTDAELRDLVGATSLQRGRAYAEQRRVTGLSSPGPNLLVATVRGQGRTYSTQVELSDDGELLEGLCSCPIGLDCKHVAAVVITARRSLEQDRDAAGPGRPGGVGAGRWPVGGPAAPPAPPAWERLLGGLLTGRMPLAGFTPLGLLVDLQQPRGGRYVADPSRTRPRVKLRPVVPGKTGWVRTGVAWNRLDYLGLNGVRVDPGQLAALQRLLQSRGQASRYYSAPDWLDLESLDGDWMAALRHCRATGITLLTDQRSPGQLLLAERPASVTFDLTRTAMSGVLLSPSVSLPDDFEARDADALGWFTVGDPPQGVCARDGADVLLAGFEPALDVDTARVLAHGPVEVPAADTARFLAGAAPALAKRFRVVSPDQSVVVAEVAPPRLRLAVAYLPGLQLGLAWSFEYAVGEVALSVPIDSPDQHATRDPAAEAALLAGVLTRPLPDVGLAVQAFDRLPQLRPRLTVTGFDVVVVLDHVLPLLNGVDGLDVVFSGERVDYAEAVEPPTVRLALSDSRDDTDWFDLSVQVSVGGRPVPMSSLVSAFALGQREVILTDGTWFRVDRPELAELQRLVAEARALQDVAPDGPLRLSPYHADLWAELESLGVVEQQSRRWAELVKGLTGPSTEALAPPPGLRAQLRPYQHEGFEWLTYLRRHGLGGILADDMGLGKTVQALAMILQERHDREQEASVAEQAAGPAPWLVVAPTSVLAGWAAEAERFAPSLRVRVLAETAARRGVRVPEAAAGADLVVTSYTVLRLDAEQFLEQDWAGVLLDEAQQVKNHRSVTYQCVRRLSARSRFAVTGTPMENNLMELWALLSIVAPGLFPDPAAFTEHYRRPIEGGQAPERLDTLRRRIRPVMLRRTKQAVATDLPAKQEQVITVELPAKHRRHYDRGLARERQRVLGLLEDPARNRVAIFRALTVLRRLSLHPGLADEEARGLPCVKIDTLLDLLAPVLAEGHQALVFSQFTSFLAMVRDRLDADGIPYAYLDGRTRRRDLAIERFRSGQAPVFLISLKAGGTGLTLTEADYVFLLDPWWNPAVEAQAVDRTHRIGQTRPVNVYRLVAGETIEDKVVALQDRKRELFATVVDEGALASGGLTDDDIRSLLR
jgi:superfamily II DNA or RNA helicase